MKDLIMPISIAISIALTSIVIYIFSGETIKPLVSVIALVLIALIVVYFWLKKDAEFQKNLILAVGFGITIISWFFVGYINNENEKKRNQLSIEQSTLQAKRDVRVKFLLDAYFRLSNISIRDTAPDGGKTLLYDFIYLKYAESALNSIQILGNDKLVKLANEFNLSAGANHKLYDEKIYNDLLKMFREELRNELNLKKLPDSSVYDPTVFRTFRRSGAPNDLTTEQQYQLIIKLNEFDRGLIK